MAQQNSVPVLIVGGGIVGLSASLFLSHLGVRSLLVERHSGTSIHPRARSLNARSMEIFRGLGLDGVIRDAGSELGPSQGLIRGSTLLEAIEPQKRSPEGATRGGKPGDSIIKTISPVVGAWVTQDMSEPALLRAARAQQMADVRFYTECTDFSQDDAGVTAEIRDRESGKTSTIHAQYLLGADGVGSPVREKLGIQRTGKGVLGHLMNILFEADLSELVRRREFSLGLITRPEVRGLFASINNGTRWVFHAVYDPAKGEKAEDFTMDRCKELVELALGMPDVEVKVKSVLPWESAVRVVQTLRKGRVFLAGDAAHQMPPWRGQGATSGIADVHNLAWKLAAVLKGEAGPALLDTYDSERLPVGRLVAEESGAVADEHGLFAMNLKVILKTIRMGSRVAGFGYTYNSPAIIPDDVSQFFRIPWHFTAWLLNLSGRPGTRVPHLWVHQDDQQISTLDVCNTNFVLLAGGEGGDAWREAAVGTAELLGIKLTVYCIGPSGDLVDPNNQWLYLAGISANGALLVRPDGFVAWRAYTQPTSITEKLNQVMRQVLCR